MKARIVVRFATVLVLLGCLVLGAAGTVRYWQGWAGVALLGGCSVAAAAYLMRRDPALLERRMRREEQRPVQKVFHYLAMCAWLLCFLLAGLGRRFGWGPVLPWWVCVLGLAAVVWGFWITFATLRANTFAAATIGIERNQHVICAGPYRIVRHPMYSGITAVVVGMSIGLGSVAALATSAIMIGALVFRLLDEEKLLRAELPGYAQYCERVHWRLAPGVF